MNVDLMIEHAHVLCTQVMHALVRIMSWIDACMLLLYSYSTMSYRLLLLDLPNRVRRILPLVYCCTVRAVVRSNTPPRLRTGLRSCSREQLPSLRACTDAR